MESTQERCEVMMLADECAKCSLTFVTALSMCATHLTVDNSTTCAPECWAPTQTPVICSTLHSHSKFVIADKASCDMCRVASKICISSA